MVRGEEREGEEALHCNGQGVKHPGVTVPTGARRITTITKKYHNHHNFWYFWYKHFKLSFFEFFVELFLLNLVFC